MIRVTEAQITEAKQMRGAGLSYQKIAEAVGFSEATVRYHLDPAKAAAYRASHREARRVRAAEYQRTHRKEISARKAKYHAAHKERLLQYGVEYYWAHRDEIKARKAKYYQAHCDEIKVREVEYRKEHRNEIKARKAEYCKVHRAEKNSHTAARYALKLGATIGNLDEIKEIYRKAKEAPKVRCYLCGKLIPKGHRHVDHIMPLSKGGAHRPSNLAAACDTCNLSKHDKTPEEIGVLI